MSHVLDIIPAAELTAVARLALADEDRPQNQLQLGALFPNDLVDSIEFEYDAGGTRTHTAPMRYRAWDTQGDIGTRPGTVRKTGELAPMTRGFLLTEYEKIRTRLASQGSNRTLADEIYGTVTGNIVAGIRAMELRQELARIEALVSGTTTFAEPGFQDLEVDWGRDPSRESNAGTAWSDPTAPVIDDEYAIVQTMSDDEGLGPDDMVAIMNQKTYRYQQVADQYRNAFDTVRTRARLTPQQVDEVRNESGLPDAVVYNANILGLDGVLRRVVPDNKIIYVPKNAPIGTTQYGVPAIVDDPRYEMELDSRPGPVAWVESSGSPNQTWTFVEGIAIPVLRDPNATFCFTTTP